MTTFNQQTQSGRKHSDGHTQLKVIVRTGNTNTNYLGEGGRDCLSSCGSATERQKAKAQRVREGMQGVLP